MSEQDSIDERRAYAVSRADPVCGSMKTFSRINCVRTGPCQCLEAARAIRLSDETAGYITAKLETLESAKERRS